MNARLALLSRDGNTFREDMRICAEWMGRYFDLSNAAVEAAKAGSGRVAEDPVGVDLPNLQASLTALRVAGRARPTHRRGRPHATSTRRPGEELKQPCADCSGCSASSLAAILRWPVVTTKATPCWCGPVSDPDLLNLLIVLLVGGFAAIYALAARRPHHGAPAGGPALSPSGSAGTRRAGGLRRRAAAHRGRFGQALKQATAAYETGESPGLAALLAARAAHSLRDETRYRYWLGKVAEEGEECVWPA